MSHGKTKSHGIGFWLTAVGWLAFGGIASAQQPAQPAPAKPGLVEAMLVKNALTAANHATITGNFTVLRDLGSASFRQRNSAGDLAAVFKGLKERRVDLSPILVMDPQFTEQPAIDQQGFLKLVGYFPTQPLQVRFALAYQRVEAGWVLDSISVGAIDPRPQPPATVAGVPAGAPAGQPPTTAAATMAPPQPAPATTSPYPSPTFARPTTPPTNTAAAPALRPAGTVKR